MACSNVILHQRVQNYPKKLLYFLSIIVKYTPVFLVLVSDGMNIDL